MLSESTHQASICLTSITELCLDLLLREGSRVPPKHRRALIHRHADLLFANGHHALSQPSIVLPQQRDRHKEVIDVVED